MAVDYRVLFPGLDCESYRNCQNESLAVIGCRDHMTHYMGSNLHEMFHSSLFENKDQNESSIHRLHSIPLVFNSALHWRNPSCYMSDNK